MIYQKRLESYYYPNQLGYEYKPFDVVYHVILVGSLMYAVQVVSRSRAVRRATREEKIREYFYGKKGPLSYFPFTFDIKFSDLKIYKIGGEAML